MGENLIQAENSSKKKEEDLPVFSKWFDFLKWFLPFTEKLPKKVRFSITQKMNNLAVDLIEDLIEAQYTKNKLVYLKSANLKLEKLRIFLRLCMELELINQKSYYYAVKSINETGKMLGGWLKQQQKLLV